MRRSFLVYLVFCAVLGSVLPLPGQADTVVGGDSGIYRFHVNTDGAEVYVDGQMKGVIAGGVLDVPVYITGTPSHTYSITKEGYRVYNGTINSVPGKGQVMNIYAHLSAMPVVEYSTVHLLVTPAGADVLWDGVSAGKVTATGIMILYNVVPGRHTLLVTKEGYAPSDQIITVPGNDDTKVPVTLQPVLFGSVSVESVPPGASVLLDGKNVGVTPLILHNIPAGPHSVTISGAGFQDSVSEIEVTGGDTAVVSMTLVPGTPVPGSTRAGLSLPLVVTGLLAAGLFVAFRRP